VLLRTAYGIWKENRLGQEVWQVIDKAVGAGRQPPTRRGKTRANVGDDGPWV
jgi:hypothetical protein